MTENSNTLYAVSEKEYGACYKEHLLEQYKLYVEMADRISQRRDSANSFFLTINTVLSALAAYAITALNNSCPPIVFLVIGICGMILCYTWHRLIKSYKGLNAGKFQVIHEIENKLPLRPYDAEWSYLGRGDNAEKYLPFTHIEMIVPWIFFSIHFIIVLTIVLIYLKK